MNWGKSEASRHARTELPMDAVRAYQNNTETARTGRALCWSIVAVAAALAAAALVVVTPANAALAGTQADVQTEYPTLPEEAQRAANEALASGAIRASARVFLWPGPNGRYDSLNAEATTDGATSFTSAPTDDIAMVIQATKADCPFGWVCLFDWRDFNAGHPNARMWKFQEVTSGYQNLHNFDAGDRTASWWNRRNHDSRLRRWGTNGYVYNCMDSQSQASQMGAAWVDEADHIRNFNSDGECGT
jgi:hypothetical protein